MLKYVYNSEGSIMLPTKCFLCNPLVREYAVIHLCEDCKAKDFRDLKLEILIRKNQLQSNEMAEYNGY
jgi:hypothetical protein